MNLTYETNENGYTIFNDGKAWITQDVYMPYPADTVEESAQAHIAHILEDFDKPIEPDGLETLTNRVIESEIETDFRLSMLELGLV